MGAPPPPCRTDPPLPAGLALCATLPVTLWVNQGAPQTTRPVHLSGVQSWAGGSCRSPDQQTPSAASGRAPMPRCWGPEHRAHTTPHTHQPRPSLPGARRCSLPLPPPPAMGYRCVCTTGTAQHKAEVQSKSRRKKLFSDMSWAPFAAANKMAWSPQVLTTPKVLQSVNLVDGRRQKLPRNVETLLQTSNSSSPLPWWTPQSTRGCNDKAEHRPRKAARSCDQSAQKAEQCPV